MQLSEFRGLGPSWRVLGSSVSDGSADSMGESPHFFEEWAILGFEPSSDLDPDLASDGASRPSEQQTTLLAEGEVEGMATQKDPKTQPLLDGGFGDDEVHKVDGPVSHDAIAPNVATLSVTPNNPETSFLLERGLGTVPQKKEHVAGQPVVAEEGGAVSDVHPRARSLWQGSEKVRNSEQGLNGVSDERAVAGATTRKAGVAVSNATEQSVRIAAAEWPIKDKSGDGEPRTADPVQSVTGEVSKQEMRLALSPSISKGQPSLSVRVPDKPSNLLPNIAPQLKKIVADRGASKLDDQTVHTPFGNAASWGESGAFARSYSFTPNAGPRQSGFPPTPVDRLSVEPSVQSLAIGQHEEDAAAQASFDTPNSVRPTGGIQQVATGHLPQATVQDLAVQVRNHAQVSGGSVMEIALRPEELGSVRILLSQTDTGMHVSISGERPETLELLRRNIDQLTEEFQAVGYQSVGVDVGNPDTPEDEHGGDRVVRPMSEGSEHEPGGNPNTNRGSDKTMSDGSLDIRI